MKLQHILENVQGFYKINALHKIWIEIRMFLPVICSLLILGKERQIDFLDLLKRVPLSNSGKRLLYPLVFLPSFHFLSNHFLKQ